jgi:hypothetical protein
VAAGAPKPPPAACAPNAPNPPKPNDIRVKHFVFLYTHCFFFNSRNQKEALAAKPERRMSLGKRRGEGESNWDSTGGYDSKRMMMSGAAGVPGGYGMQGFSAAAMPGYGMMPVKSAVGVRVRPPLSHHVGAHLA